MTVSVGFGEADITPPEGTLKIGWKRVIVSDQVLDPIYAKICAITNGSAGVGFVQLDTLSVRWTQVNEIRRRISKEYGYPGQNVMVAATHNHAGPAVANCGDVPRDEEYIRWMVDRVVTAFGEALENRARAEIGFGSTFEFDVGFNRRVVMRDGSVRTHGRFDDPEALYIEGPIDPEVHVMAVKSRGDLVGAVVNFACHPAHHGGTTEISGGYPEVLARIMKERGCPWTLFLDGASGNITTVNPIEGGNLPKEEAGRKLADDVGSVLEGIEYTRATKIASQSRTIELPYRNISQEEMEGRVRGAQRFIDSAIYDREMPWLLERLRRSNAQLAEVQVIRVGDQAYAGMPAEYFVQLGLRIKEESHPVHALVVGQANGMVGYIPHRDAFLRGGYETTLCNSSRMAPEAGDLLADCAIEIVKKDLGF